MICDTPEQAIREAEYQAIQNGIKYAVANDINTGQLVVLPLFSASAEPSLEILETFNPPKDT